MGARQELAAQSLFREVNDRVAELGRGSDISQSVASTTLNLICECGSSACARRIELTVAEFESVRTDDELSLLSPVHREAWEGRVVGGGSGYLVVRAGRE